MYLKTRKKNTGIIHNKFVIKKEDIQRQHHNVR
jgi:hypothetical protein